MVQSSDHCVCQSVESFTSLFPKRVVKSLCYDSDPRFPHYGRNKGSESFCMESSGQVVSFAFESISLFVSHSLCSLLFCVYTIMFRRGMSYLLPSEPPEEDDSDSQVLYEPEDHSNTVNTGRCMSNFFTFFLRGSRVCR